MRRTMAAAAMALALAGCAEPHRPGELGADDIALSAHRAWDTAFSTIPFETGVVRIVAPVADEMQTFVLVACHDGQRICAENTRGRAGRLVVGPDYYVVTGAYPGHAFYLSPGGNGYLMAGEYAVPLAWD